MRRFQNTQRYLSISMHPVWTTKQTVNVPVYHHKRSTLEIFPGIIELFHRLFDERRPAYRGIY